MCTVELFSQKRGFTLPELLLLIVVLFIGLAGILLAINTNVAASADPLLRKQALAAAESILEEILLMPFDNPPGGWSGAATQANRQLFDDVRDYNTFQTAGVFTIDGAPITGLEDYNLRVDIAGTALSAGATLVDATNSLRVTVRVTGPRVDYVLEGYKLSYP